MSATSIWFAGVCKACDYPVVVMQSPTTDYWWYCSNKDCPNHDPGEQTGDMEVPDFVGKWLKV